MLLNFGASLVGCHDDDDKGVDGMMSESDSFMLADDAERVEVFFFLFFLGGGLSGDGG